MLRRGLRAALYACASFMVVVAVVSGVAAWGWHDLNTPVPLPPGGAMVSVAPGETFRVTSERLQAAGVVRHAWVMRLWARWQGADHFVRGGDYRFEQPLSPMEILAVLRSPVAALHR